MLTIKSFSRITAIPESTLRYYDEQGILRPRGRAESGYRLYEADQILPAKFLYSLRLAAVPMADVKAYQQDPPEHQQAALARWHQELGERIAWLTLARKYIEGLREGRKEEVTLQVTPPEQVAWFVHEGPVGMFGEHYMRRQQDLTAAGFVITDSYFEWVADLEPGWVRGKVGYTVTGKHARLPEGGELEERPSMLTPSPWSTGRPSLRFARPTPGSMRMCGSTAGWRRDHRWSGTPPGRPRFMWKC